MLGINTLNLVNNIDYGFAKLTHEFSEIAGDFVTGFMRFYTILGNSGMAFIILSLLLLLFRKTRRIGMICAGAIIIGALITNVTLKNIVQRDRPFWDQTSDYYTWWQAAGSLEQDGFSFPSGHATASMAFSFALFLTGKKKFSWAYLFIALLMGYSRVYFQVHYATDVLVGLLVGVLAASASYFIVKALFKWSFTQKIHDLPGLEDLFKKKENN